MQSGELIWLLTGIGIGLVIAMLMLAGMLVIDGRRLQRRASATGELMRNAPPEPKVDAAPARKIALVPDTPRRTSVPRPVPPAPAPREPVVVDAKPSEPAAVIVDEMMSNLAAEIARVQTAEPATVVIEAPPPAALPEPAPVSAPIEAVASEPQPIELPAPEPVSMASIEVTVEPPADPTPIVVAEAPIVVAPPPAPKVPPLPKVTPARKFAPALPPRSPQEGGKA